MSAGGIIGGFLRGTMIAAATAATAFGLLVVFEPFARPVTSETVAITSSTSSGVLQGRIEAVRLALRETEASLGDGVAAGPSPDAANRAQYEVQVAAATERRDLALRQAAAIRAGLESGIAVSSLAQIRDSVVIGQLLSRQSALEGQIAVDGARLRANHPTMRALTAQRASLATQIRQEATNIASALEAEAKLDDAQIELLQSQLPAAVGDAAPADRSTLETRAAAQRAELDGLVDAYFNIPPATAVTRSATPANPLSIANLLVVAIAGLVAILFQLFLSMRRRREARAEADMAAWHADQDAEPETDDPPIAEPEPLRKAS